RCRTRRRARLAPASRRGDASPPPEELFGRLLGFGLFAAVLALARRHRDLLGLGRRAGDERDVDLVLVLARDEDGRVRRQRAAEDEVGERILDEALDRPPERPRAHRRVVALLDEEVLRV